MPNSAVDMDSWAELACYPRSSFYPLIFHRSYTEWSVHLILLSHLLDMTVSQLSRLFLIQVQRGFHPRQADLDKPLRYFLGGLRPTQTAHQTLSPRVFAAKVRI